MRGQYIQRLPALALSIERCTPTVPEDGAWYLLRDGQMIGRFRTLKAAQGAWKEIVDAFGFKPSGETSRTPKEILAAERAARDRDARNEYWHSGRRHAW